MMEENRASMAVKVTACGPLIKSQQKIVKAQRLLSAGIVRVMLIIMVAALCIQPVYYANDITTRRYTLPIIYGALLLAVVWRVIRKILEDSRERRPSFSEFNQTRIIELYEEGLLSSSIAGRTVIEFGDIQQVIENKDLFIVKSEEGEIVWSSTDLTNADFNFIRSFILNHAPQGVSLVIKPFVALRSEPYGIPQLPSRGEKLKVANAEMAFQEIALDRWNRLIQEGASLLFLVSASVSCLLVQALTFKIAIFQNPLIWFCLFALSSVLISYGFVYKEVKQSVYKLNKTKPYVVFYPGGVLITVGSKQTYIPKAYLHTSGSKDGLVLATGETFVKIPWDNLQDFESASYINDTNTQYRQ